MIFTNSAWLRRFKIMGTTTSLISEEYLVKSTGKKSAIVNSYQVIVNIYYN